jgi:hypothetical protein
LFNVAGFQDIQAGTLLRDDLLLHLAIASV